MTSKNVFVLNDIPIFDGQVTIRIPIEIYKISSRYFMDAHCIDIDELNIYIIQDTYENAYADLISQLEFMWRYLIDSNKDTLFYDAKKIKQYLLDNSIQRPKNRITKNEYYLDIARAVSQRSTCLRRQYGCVLVKNDEIISTGYNGSARGEENCCDKGVCWREENGIPHGEQYEKCVAVHAEQNAIISAARSDMIGATAYLVGFENGKEIEAKPCLICERMLKNAGINNVTSDIFMTLQREHP